MSEEQGVALSVVMPVRNEAEVIRRVLDATAEALSEAKIPFEFVVVDDRSTDDTVHEVAKARSRTGSIRCLPNGLASGFGNAIHWGLRHTTGDILAVMMGDGSDSPQDLIRYVETIESGYDCAFGHRFLEASEIEGYPTVKYVFNRVGNWLVACLFALPYTDVTNAFKAYRASVVDRLLPLRSEGFEVTLELPLRAVGQGASFAVVPVSWKDRSTGTSKMHLASNLARYLARLALLRVGVT